MISMFIDTSLSDVSIALIKDGKLLSNGTLLLIMAIAIGTFIGEFIKIEQHMNDFAYKLEKKINKGKR